MSDFYDKKNFFINSLNLDEKSRFDIRNRRFDNLFKRVFEEIEKASKVVEKPCVKVEFKPFKRRLTRKKKSVAKICPDTGNQLEIFDSINSASKAVGGHHSHIVNALNGKIELAYGFKWKEVDRHKVCPACKELLHESKYRTEIHLGKAKLGTSCLSCEKIDRKITSTIAILREQGIKGTRNQLKGLALEYIPYAEKVRQREYSNFVKHAIKTNIEQSFEEYKK